MDPGWQPDGQLFGEIYDSTCYQTRAHKIMHTARKEELVCLLGLVCNLYFVILLGLIPYKPTRILPPGLYKGGSGT